MIINLNILDNQFKYVINPKFIGTFVVLLYKDKLFPIYVLNQNYVRFNHCNVNVEVIFQFINKQQFRHYNYIQHSYIHLVRCFGIAIAIEFVILTFISFTI